MNSEHHDLWRDMKGLVKSEGFTKGGPNKVKTETNQQNLYFRGPWMTVLRIQWVGRLARERCECWYNPGEWMICWGVIPVIFSGDDHTDTPAGLQLGNSYEALCVKSQTHTSNWGGSERERGCTRFVLGPVRFSEQCATFLLGIWMNVAFVSTFVHRLEGVYCRKEDSKFMVRALSRQGFPFHSHLRSRCVEKLVWLKGMSGFPVPVKINHIC